MIDEVDDALRAVIRRDALNGADVEIVFDAPTKDWAARRNAPTIDVYLYDIREDLGRREFGRVDIRNADGRIVARQDPPRYFKFSYLITAWTQRPEDEHRLLSAVLRCFLKYEVLPMDTLTGSLEAQGYPVGVKIGLPPPQDRSVSDVWSALGGELKPSLDLVALVAIDTRGLLPVAPLVLEPPIIGLGRPAAAAEKADGKGKGKKDAPAAAAAAAGAAAAKEGAAAAAATKAGAKPAPAQESVGAGLQGPGRVVRMRSTK